MCKLAHASAPMHGSAHRHSNFAPSGEKTHPGGTGLPKPWFFTFTFALSCITIASGCLAERTQLLAYPTYTVRDDVVVVDTACNMKCASREHVEDGHTCTRRQRTCMRVVLLLAGKWMQVDALPDMQT